MIELEIDLPSDTLNMLALQAHNNDMKLNDYIISILTDRIQKTTDDESIDPQLLVEVSNNIE